jgi:uncharacterized protein (DUF488 family)
MVLLTVGHGTLDQRSLTDLLVGADIEHVVDIRTAPGSRRHPHVAGDALAAWLPAAGIAYRWEPRLGGWRKPDPGSRNTALRHPSFRGYADYMASPAFWEALDDVLAEADRWSTTVLCSETLYWRCHRRLVADAAVLGCGASVLHLGHDGRRTPHRLTDGVRSEDGQPVYDVGSAPPLPGVTG